MSTAPVTPAPTAPSATAAWVNLLLGIGASVGGAFVTNPALQGIIASGISAAQQLVSTLLNKPAGGNVALPVFLTALQATFGILEATNKISATEAAALKKAVADTLAADNAAQIAIDPSVLTPIAPLP